MTNDLEIATGIVVIGRNEGARLSYVFDVLASLPYPIVYVDSCSTDNSVVLAQESGIDVLELDPSCRLSAARARNEGYDYLVGRLPSLSYIQFIDGDCVPNRTWFEEAIAYLDTHSDVGVVFGHISEETPERNAYHRLLQMEWDVPVGRGVLPTGTFMTRTRLFADAGKFDPSLIAGEDGELCRRIERQGYHLCKLDVSMAMHDIAMSSAMPYLKRQYRSGHAYAEQAWLAREKDKGFRLKELRSIFVWGGVFPLVALAGVWKSWAVPIVVGLFYVLLLSKVFAGKYREGVGAYNSWIYAVSVVLGKIPECLGACRYFIGRILRRPRKLIEY